LPCGQVLLGYAENVPEKIQRSVGSIRASPEGKVDLPAGGKPAVVVTAQELAGGVAAVVQVAED
jgi:hypothetical protein